MLIKLLFDRSPDFSYFIHLSKRNEVVSKIYLLRCVCVEDPPLTATEFFLGDTVYSGLARGLVLVA